MTDILFPRSIGRLSFFVRNLITGVIGMPLSLLFDEDQFQSTGILILACVLTLILAIYCLLYVIIPRCRDLNMNAWLSLLIFIPIANAFFAFILLFFPSRRGMKL